MASRRKGRVLAFQALFSWEASRSPLTELLEFTWLEKDKRGTLDGGTAEFSRLLIAGTIENMGTIDALIKSHRKNWDFSRLNRVDLAVLRMSTYALLYQKDVAPSIVIDEAIDIAKEYGTDDSFRFVNGVLDGIKKTIQNEASPAQPK
jgi:N utilization substance protein B